jgi:TolB protein
MHARCACFALAAVIGLALTSARARAQQGDKPPDENLLGEFVVTGTVREHVTRLAILPSLAPDLEDVILRGVVRRDFELTGMFDVIPDRKAPPGLYGFDDPVDIAAWRKLGAEVIVKVAARKHQAGKIQVFGLAYFLNVGQDPVYEKRLRVDPSQVRVTAHRITDALLGAITGRPGGFASHLTFSAKWGRNRRVFTMDADGHALTPVTDASDTAIAPTWGPTESLYYTISKKYSPFKLMSLVGGQHQPVKVPFSTSVYSVAFNSDYTKMAVAVAAQGGSSIWVGGPDGSGMVKVSKTQLSTHPVFSPSGKLAWIGGDPKRRGSQRVYVDGKPVSPAGFTAAAPAFCDTEDGIRLVYSVAVGGDAQDLVMSNERGQGIARLTQHQGTNTYPACSPDGRLLAFFSTRGKRSGMYLMSLKRWKTQQLATQYGESLRWAALPPPPAEATP